MFPTLNAGDVAPLLRIVMGAAFMVHGLPKLRGGWKQSGQWIQSMGVPAFAAVPVTLLEFFGGLFLVLGLIVPIVAGFFAIQMLSIVVMKKSKMNASFVGSQGKPAYEVDVLYLLLALALVVLGAGALSIDSIVGI
ncbi:MAG: DoxX family protein [Nitrososphaerales archaeon]|nr:DoxX family protein [Nitrososphaerales archaeon]